MMRRCSACAPREMPAVSTAAGASPPPAAVGPKQVRNSTLPGQGHGGEGHCIPAESDRSRLAVELADDGHVIELPWHGGRSMGAKRAAPGERRGPGRPPIEPVAPQGHGETGCQDVDGHAAHHLITPVGVVAKPCRAGHQGWRSPPDPQPNPGGTGDGGAAALARRRRLGQLALQGDVDHRSAHKTYRPWPPG